MYRLAEIEDIDQIAELRILQKKELFKKWMRCRDDQRIRKEGGGDGRKYRSRNITGNARRCLG